jgi:hypothetical protein
LHSSYFWDSRRFVFEQTCSFPLPISFPFSLASSRVLPPLPRWRVKLWGIVLRWISWQAPMIVYF